MSSTTMTTMARDLAPPTPVTRYGWAWLGGLAILFYLVFQVILVKSYQFAISDADWSHALIVPLISVYFIYQARDELASVTKRVCWWGLPILLAGLVFHAFWIFPGRNHMFQGYSMIIALFGLVLFVLGPGAMRYLWVPILYLGFAIKVSDKLWELIALKLQLLAAQGAAVLINFFGAAMDLEAAVRGSIIELTYRGEVQPPMEVAQACAGLRMLMAFIALGVAVAFLARRPWWQRLVVILSTVPIAVLINVVRVTVLGFIYPFDRELASGDFHTLVGMLMLIPAAGLFLLMGWILDKVFVIDEEADTDASDDKASASPQSSTPAADTAASGAEAPVGPSLSWSGWGALWGVVVTLAMGGAYLATLAWLRPDVVGWVNPSLAGVLMVALTIVTLAACVGVIPLLRKAGPRGDRRPRWLALGLVAGVLLTTWLGQQGVIASTRAVMFKEPIELRHQLFELPTEVGSWSLLRKDPPLPDEVVKELGTENYISMIYENMDLEEHEPGRFVRLHVAYYTGMIDTAPHVPERCFVGGGISQLGSDITTLDLNYAGARPDPESDGLLVPTRLGPPEDARLPGEEVGVRRVTFADPQNPASRFHVMYFFVANGGFMATAEAVRVRGFNMTDRYSYYCKVEAQVLGADDAEVARARVESLLTPMLPEIMTCLPDWVDVRAGRYPASAADPPLASSSP